MLLNRHRLAAKEAAPPCVAPVPHVHRRDVRNLVIGVVKKRSPGVNVSIEMESGATSIRTALFGEARAPALA